MSLFEVQKLSRENKQLRDKIASYEMKIKCITNDCQAFEEMLEKSKNDKSYLEKQIKELKRREEQKHYERQDMQNRYLNVLKKMEDEIEDRKRKYQKLQTKIEPLINHDTVRLKILNEVESGHNLQIEQYKRNIQSLKDQVLKLKRQNQLLKHRIETDKMDYQERVRKLNNRYNDKVNNDHFNETTYELCMEIEGRLKTNYEQARKQSDYYKDKYFTNQRKNQEKITNLERQLYLLKQKFKGEGHL